MVWALLHVHRGHLSRDGSLSHWFAVLEKTRLGSAHPDYHALLTAMMQILDGLLLDAWRIECGYSSLSAFATAKPTPDQLLSVADKILANHATPLERTHKDDTNCSDPVMDKAHQNTRLLVHDLLYVAEVTRAISAGDWGRVEDILPKLAMIFRGAGSKNYCTEILHFIHNLKKVWKGEGFDDLVRDNMIVNMSGIPGKGEGVDENMEHNIGATKELFAAKGMYASWERLANISASIDILNDIKKNVATSLDASYKGRTHKIPDASNLIWRVALKAQELKLGIFIERREGNDEAKAVVDVLASGERLLKTSTLATFNKKLRYFKEGTAPPPDDPEDIDDIPAMNLTLNSEESEE